jgi:WD repeat-containing protein 76
MYISDTKGGVTHLDLRASRHEARRFQLSGKEKIGGISLNPVDNWSLLAACNDRSLKLWDTRMLMKMPMPSRDDPDVASALVEPYETDYDDVSEWIDKKKATLRGTWVHGFSVSSVYWDPSGSRILSTCYDDTLRGDSSPNVPLSF